MNRLFVVNKPIFISSNNYMYHIKRKYGVKKVGFSGTLDPFATGCLIVATGSFTKLFQYLNKTPKTYRATLWLGAKSHSLDIENIVSIKEIKKLRQEDILNALNLPQTLTYLPPKYSAKKISGQKAYKLARENRDMKLKEITSVIYNTKLINYNHPFITFEITVSEGSYIRSIAQIIAQRLGVEDATLSALHRIKEGRFFYNNEEPLNPYEHLKIGSNIFLKDDKILELGKKIDSSYFQNQKDGTYLIKGKNFYSIIEIKDKNVKYKLNRLPKEWK